MKKFLKIMAGIFSVLLLIVLIVVAAFMLSPKPGAYVIGHMFNQPVELTDEKRYQEVESKVAQKVDLTYQSDYPKSGYDLFYPKDVENQTKSLPVVFWVHGGGFVAGDKEGSKEFAVYLAEAAHVAVISLNYEWAPALTYPGQVKQIDQAYQSIKAQAKEYPMLDFDQVVFGGDSAGAQIAGQYAVIQTNADYAKEMNMAQTIPAGELKGFISYSGPLNLKQILQQKSDSAFMKFFVNTVAWSLLGKREWKESSELQQASLAEHVTADFPPTYITDGNAFSFADQGIAFEERLTKLNIPVQGLFYEDTDKELAHEYQFDYSLEESKMCLEQTVQFLKEQMLAQE